MKRRFDQGVGTQKRGGSANAPRTRRNYRTEWRVVSSERPPRFETYDISFGPGEIVHKTLAIKLEFVERQLKQNVLKYGDSSIELSKCYFIGKE